MLSLQKIKNSKSGRLLICFVVLTFSVVGCVSKTVIKSIPAGADVYIDGLRKGVTPMPYSDTAIAGTTKRLVLKKKGFRDVETLIRKSEFQVGPCIGGVLILFPFIWVLGYPDEYEIELETLEQTQSMLYLLHPNVEPSL